MSEKKSWLGDVLAAAQNEIDKLPPWMRRKESVEGAKESQMGAKDSGSEGSEAQKKENK
jgi:hypothetical protein